MKITIGQIGKTYEVGNDDKLKVTHVHDAIISVNGEYFKNKYTNEWVSEQEAKDAYDVFKLEQENDNKYY